MLLNKKRFAALMLVISVSSHASDTTSEVNREQLAAVKTVTVVYPGKPVYIAFGPSGAVHIPIPLPGAGVVGALAAGAAAGAVNAGLGKNDDHSPTLLNDLVTARFGDTGLNRRFTDRIETVLRNHGFTVKEVDASAPGLPTLSPTSISRCTQAARPIREAMRFCSFASEQATCRPAAITPTRAERSATS
ncbi:hypothetical protein [Burkholderia multivorans]|uniref:hypothetical protein n=1 Tax=Burkholderia multivorans TaxID=87883 RepID=UPI0021BEEB73|nr:hypothetical protein [Burkholderia multivorans]